MWSPQYAPAFILNYTKSREQEFHGGHCSQRFQQNFGKIYRHLDQAPLAFSNLASTNMIWTSQKLPALDSSEKHGSGLQQIIENTRSTPPVHQKNTGRMAKIRKVKPSNSFYNSPISCVPKKQGQGLRITQDIRELNLNSHMDKWRR
jgi:hypothetical protein